MKSKLVVLIVFSVLTQMVYAQKFGVKGGLNIANFTYEGDKDNFFDRSITGFHVGPVIDYTLTERIHINSGLLYSLKGTMINSIGDNGGTEYVPIKTNNLDIPLNLCYQFTLNEKSLFLIQGGPYVDYTLSATIKSDGNYEKLQLGGESHLQRFDYGLNMGTGLQFGALVTSLNYEFGLADRTNSEVTTKSKILQLSLAYMFGY